MNPLKLFLMMPFYIVALMIVVAGLGIKAAFYPAGKMFNSSESLPLKVEGN